MRLNKKTGLFIATALIGTAVFAFNEYSKEPSHPNDSNLVKAHKKTESAVTETADNNIDKKGLATASKKQAHTDNKASLDPAPATISEVDLLPLKDIQLPEIVFGDPNDTGKPPELTQAQLDEMAQWDKGWENIMEEGGIDQQEAFDLDNPPENAPLPEGLQALAAMGIPQEGMEGVQTQKLPTPDPTISVAKLHHIPPSTLPEKAQGWQQQRQLREKAFAETLNNSPERKALQALRQQRETQEVSP